MIIILNDKKCIVLVLRRIETFVPNTGKFLPKLLRYLMLNPNRVLSKARGVMRLRRLYRSAPSLSRQRAVEAFLEGSTAILTDQLVLGPELLEGEVAEPTDDEVAAFFAEYRDNPEGNTDESAGGNAFGFGYLLPARVKLEWLALERSRIAEVVVPDPVAVRRRWQRASASAVAQTD